MNLDSPALDTVISDLSLLQRVLAAVDWLGLNPAHIGWQPARDWITGKPGVMIYWNAGATCAGLTRDALGRAGVEVFGNVGRAMNAAAYHQARLEREQANGCTYEEAIARADQQREGPVPQGHMMPLNPQAPDGLSTP